jgi:hypothetical protein
LLIPVVSITLLVMNRKRILSEIGYSPAVGLSVIAAGLVSYAAGILWNRQFSASGSDQVNRTCTKLRLPLYASFRR